MFAAIKTKFNAFKAQISARLVKFYVVVSIILAATLTPLTPMVPTFAQTPVPLVVPTNEIFEQTNTWMDVFAPVVAIGVGIAIALAILTFIGNEILKAFRR